MTRAVAVRVHLRRKSFGTSISTSRARSCHARLPGLRDDLQRLRVDLEPALAGVAAHTATSSALRTVAVSFVRRSSANVLSCSAAV